MIFVHGIIARGKRDEKRDSFLKEYAWQRGCNKVLIFEYAPEHFYPGDVAAKWSTTAAGYKLTDTTGKIISRTEIYPSVLGHSDGTVVINKASYFMQGKKSYIPYREPGRDMTKARWNEVVLIGSNIDLGTNLRYLEESVAGLTPEGKKAILNCTSSSDVVSQIFQWTGDSKEPAGIDYLGKERNFHFEGVKHSQWLDKDLLPKYNKGLPPSNPPKSRETNIGKDIPQIRAVTLKDLLNSSPKPPTYEAPKLDPLTPFDNYEEVYDQKNYRVSKRDAVGKILEIKDSKDRIIWRPEDELKRMQSIEDRARNHPEELNTYRSEYEGERTEFKSKYPELWPKLEEWKKGNNKPPGGGAGGFPVSQANNLKHAEGLGGIDFTSIRLNYILAYPDPNISAFSYVMNVQKDGNRGRAINVEDAAKLSLGSFFIGLALPNQTFWVNLNKSEPNRIIDAELGKTDIGRIMLEADLRLKKDFCRLTNPKISESGRTYWDLLYRNMKGLIPGKDIQITGLTRFWIVPDEILVAGNDHEVYIERAILKVCLESEYFSTRGIKYSTPQGTSNMEQYSTKLIKEHILPLLIKEVNEGQNYAELRQVFNSLVMAQYYKQKFALQVGMFSDLRSNGRVQGFESRNPWSAKSIWNDFVYSIDQGEYSFQEETIETKGNYTIKTSKYYFSGGVDFTNIKIKVVGNKLDQGLKTLLLSSIYTPLGSYANGGYFFGDSNVSYIPEISRFQLPEVRSNAKGHSSNKIIPLGFILILIISIVFLLWLLYSRNRSTSTSNSDDYYENDYPLT